MTLRWNCGVFTNWRVLWEVPNRSKTRPTLPRALKRSANKWHVSANTLCYDHELSLKSRGTHMTAKNVPLALTKIVMSVIYQFVMHQKMLNWKKILTRTTGSSKSICFYLIPTYFLFTYHESTYHRHDKICVSHLKYLSTGRLLSR